MKKKLHPIDLTLGALFVCLMAIGANITAWFPMLAIPIGGASVPLSLQTFFAILAGLILGKGLGSIAMITYTLLGVIGVPVFAGLKAGPIILLSPTGGFILSFIFVAFFVSWITEKKSKQTLSLFTIASLVGLIINYFIGVAYMYLAMNIWLDLPISYLLTWSSMIPFFIKDLSLAFLAAVFMVRIAKIIPYIKMRITV